MRCSFSPLAEFDLEEIGDYIARDNPSRALSFVREIRELCEDIKDMPEAYPLRPDLGDNIRMIPFKAYLIFYSAGEEIRIERVLHGARNYSSLFDNQ